MKPNFALIDPHSGKIREGMGEIFNSTHIPTIGKTFDVAPVACL